MGLSGQSFPGQPGPQLLRWEPRHWPGLFSRQRVAVSADRILSGAVRRLDATLRRRQGIIEFTDDPDCILRLSARRAEAELALSDRVVQRGQWIGEIHFWNEHIPPMGIRGANIVWGAAMRRRLRQSLASLAAFVECDGRFADIDVFRGELAFRPDKELNRMRCLASGLGFEIMERASGAGIAHRFLAMGQTIFLWGMVRTYNRGALRTFDRLACPAWFQFWMTRETLRRIYGDKTAAMSNGWETSR
jgi:hypothetical protein